MLPPDPRGTHLPPDSSTLEKFPESWKIFVTVTASGFWQNLVGIGIDGLNSLEGGGGWGLPGRAWEGGWLVPLEKKNEEAGFHQERVGISREKRGQEGWLHRAGKDYGVWLQE